MRALAIERFGELDDLIERDVAEPNGPGVKVRVHAAALNPADFKVITHKDGGGFLHASRFPLVPGFDFSGVVEQPEGGFRVGDEVFGHLPYSRSTRQGTLAEYVIVPAGTIANKPSNVSHTDAAAVATVGLSALQALRDKGRIQKGMRVLINGASGGVGSMAVQIAKHLGAEVVAVCSAAKAEQVSGLGADQVVDYRSESVTGLSPAFDIVFDCAATLSLWKARPILKRGGSYVTTLPSLDLLTGTLLGWTVGRRCKLFVVKPNTADLDELARLIASGSVRAPIDEVVPWDRLRVVDALGRLRAGNVSGKIAVVGPAGEAKTSSNDLK